MLQTHAQAHAAAKPQPQGKRLNGPRLRQLLKNKQTLRTAMVLSEVLNKPVSLRD